MEAEEIADVIVDRLAELGLVTGGPGVPVQATVEALIAVAHTLALNALGPAAAGDLVTKLVEAVVRGMRTSSN
jgi:hypothetical protein